MGDGIDLLRAHRGPQQVSFSEIADHLFDYCDLNPREATALKQFAAFLAAVEYIPHDHDADPDRGIPAQPDTPIARSIHVG